MTEDSPNLMNDDELEMLDKRISDLMNERRMSRGEKGIRLTSKELSAIDEIAKELAIERTQKTTGARTYKIHMNGGTPVSFEVVHVRSVKRQLN